jgi:large subunit ribosomal protein L24
MAKIIKNDQVIVIAGRDKGKIGTVLRVIANEKVLVDGVMLAKKHTKPNPNKNIVGGVVDKALPIHISNVAIYNQETKKRDRIGYKIEDGKKSRIFKSTGKIIG